MAKKKKAKLDAGAERVDPNEALKNLERPGINWRVIGLVVVAFAIMWVIAGVAIPTVGYVGVIVVGVLTVAAIGFGLYLLRMTRKSSAIVDIMRGATDAEGRAAALARLQAESPEGKDAMNALAQAQLLAQDDPAAAVEKLESIDIDKAPAILRNDVRAQLALMYLVTNKTRKAADVAAGIQPEAQPQKKQKAMYAAVKAESLARTGKAKEAREVLEDFDEADAELAEVRPLLLRAQVYTYHGLKKRGLVSQTFAKLIAVEPGIVAAMAQKGHPELRQMAMVALQKSGVVPKQRVRMR